MLQFNNKDMNLLILLSEIATIEQLARNKLDNALPKDLNISSFSVLNHFSGSRAEKTPLQLARSFHVTKGAMTNTLNKLENRDIYMFALTGMMREKSAFQLVRVE